MPPVAFEQHTAWEPTSGAHNPQFVTPKSERLALPDAAGARQLSPIFLTMVNGGPPPNSGQLSAVGLPCACPGDFLRAELQAGL